MFHRRTARSFVSFVLSVFTSLGALASLGLTTGCALDPLMAVNDELHPSGGKYIVTATFSPWHHGYYSAAITIHNETNRVLVLKPSMFRLEGTPPTGFVAAGRIPWMMGRAGYRMPEKIDARCTAQGEIYYGIRGTKKPVGKIRFYVDLPDGEHAFEWSLIE